MVWQTMITRSDGRLAAPVIQTQIVIPAEKSRSAFSQECACAVNQGPVQMEKMRQAHGPFAVKSEERRLVGSNARKVLLANFPVCSYQSLCNGHALP
jgi:hypothetical protein